MRITAIDAAWLQFPIAAPQQHSSDFGRVTSFDAALVRVATDTGLVGWGEAKNAAGSAGSYAGLVAVINRDLAPRLIGRDPRDVAVLWEELYSGVRGHFALARGHVFPDMARRGHQIAAISGIDIALWDILGKSLGVPVWRLLGGRKAETMPAYASGGWADADNIGAQLEGYIARGGFRAVKMRVGAMDGAPHRSAARVIAARRHLGPDVQLMCDAHGTFTVAEARRFAWMVRDCDLTWFEEPVAADDKPGMAEVRAAGHAPIAAGESEYTRFDFRDLIAHRAVDVLQPDLAICGGLTEAVRIGALASAHNLLLAPHLWAGAPAFAAGLHVLAASPAGMIVEYSLGANPMLHDLIEESFVPVDGMIAIPDRPGLGITVREDVVRAHGRRMSDRNALVGRLLPFLLLRRYEPGERVPSERELAERFKVSRGQIREALSYLEALRVIERRAKSGVFMAAEESSVEALALFAQLGIPLTAADVQQSVETRHIHEIAAIRLACARRTEANLSRLREVPATEAIHVAAGQSMAEDDRQFHSEIIRATQNNVFVRIVNIFYIMTSVQRAVYFRDTERARQSHEEHVRMFAAVEQHDAELAVELMTAHLNGVDSHWQRLIERDGGRIAMPSQAAG